MSRLMKIKEICLGVWRRIRGRLPRRLGGTGGWRPQIKLALAAIRRFALHRMGEFRHQPAWLIVVVLVAAGFWLWLGPRAGILWFVFLIFLVYDWDDRAIGIAALMALTACPILLALNRDALAETAAVWAYFLLVMTVGLQIVEYRRHPDRYQEK